MLHFTEVVLATKRPKTLHHIIQGPADDVSQNLGPEPMPMKCRIANGKHGVAGPEIEAAANHVLGKLLRIKFHLSFTSSQLFVIYHLSNSQLVFIGINVNLKMTNNLLNENLENVKFSITVPLIIYA